MYILVLFIYIKRLASKEIFSPSNKIHREVGRAKDLSAPLYILNEGPDNNAWKEIHNEELRNLFSSSGISMSKSGSMRCPVNAAYMEDKLQPKFSPPPKKKREKGHL
jgi:hypothetical protein